MILIGAPSDFDVILNNFVKILSLNQRVHQSLIEYTKTRFNITIQDFSASKFLKTPPLKALSRTTLKTM